MQELVEFGQCMVQSPCRPATRLSMIYIDAARFRRRSPSLDTGAGVDLTATLADGPCLSGRCRAGRRAQRHLGTGVRTRRSAGRRLDLQRGVAKALRDIRELGVCCSFGDWQKDVNAIALPVRPGGGLPPMATDRGAPACCMEAGAEFLPEKVRPRLIALVHELRLRSAPPVEHRGDGARLGAQTPRRG